jgi:hypothetical protein
MIPSPSANRTPPSTPSRENNSASVIPPRIQAALEKALPGVDSNKLIQSLDKLFGSRGNYTVVGSTSMHLHALEFPNATRSLPLPNDIDVVVNERAINKLNLATPDTLSNLGLRRNPDNAHVLHMAQSNQTELKIDVVASKTPGFMKYQSNPHEIDGVQVGRLSDCLIDYQQRTKEPEFIQQCGGKAEADQKTQPWLNYFDQFTASAKTNSPDVNTASRKRLFQDSPEQSNNRAKQDSLPSKALKF